MRAKALILAAALVWAFSAQAGPLHDFGVIQPKTRLLAPDFTLIGLDGKSHSLSSYRGKIVMLHFWATWCIPCRQEMPVLHALKREYEGRNFAMLCVNVDRSNRDAVETFMHEIGEHFHTLLDPDGGVRNSYSVRALPTTYLIGRDGKFSGLIIGERDWTRAAPVLASLLDEGHEQKEAKDSP